MLLGNIIKCREVSPEKLAYKKTANIAESILSRIIVDRKGVTPHPQTKNP